MRGERDARGGVGIDPLAGGGCRRERARCVRAGWVAALAHAGAHRERKRRGAIVGAPAFPGVAHPRGAEDGRRVWGGRDHRGRGGRRGG